MSAEAVEDVSTDVIRDPTIDILCFESKEASDFDAAQHAIPWHCAFWDNQKALFWCQLKH
jgi:hypothetical protein